MSLVFNLNYKFNTFALLTELDRHKSTICPYIDKRYVQINDFKILRSNNICTVMDQECARFLKYYNFNPQDGEPRYYILKSNAVLPMHTDTDTLCSVNHLLEGKAPIQFENNITFNYTTALLDISKPHGVNNVGQPDRLLFKVSFFHHTFEEVKLKIMNKQ